MYFIKGLLLVISFFAIIKGDCDGFNWYHDIEINDCNSRDIKTLQKFITNSGESLEMDMDVNLNGQIDILELGWQLWEDGRLIHWICQEVPSPYYFYEYDCGLSGKIPDEIGNLNSLIKLRLQDNHLTDRIPESICNLKIVDNGFYWFNLENNQLCPPYPECVANQLGDQILTNCK